MKRHPQINWQHEPVTCIPSAVNIWVYQHTEFWRACFDCVISLLTLWQSFTAGFSSSGHKNVVILFMCEQFSFNNPPQPLIYVWRGSFSVSKRYSRVLIEIQGFTNSAITATPLLNYTELPMSKLFSSSNSGVQICLEQESGMVSSMHSELRTAWWATGSLWPFCVMVLGDVSDST